MHQQRSRKPTEVSKQTRKWLLDFNGVLRINQIEYTWFRAEGKG